MKIPTSNDRLVKPAEAAVLLAVCRRTLRRYAAQGKLHRIKLNPRATRYRLADVMRLMGKEIES
jgi:predicted site-specific integrase-resolvase